MIPLILGTKSCQDHTESRMVVARGTGRTGNGAILFNGQRVSILKDEKSYGSGDGCTL